MKERLLLLVLACVQFTHIIDFMIMMPLGPQLMRTFGISPQQFSLLVSSYTFSAGIFGFLAAFFLDKFDRKAALQVIYAGFTVGTLLCGLAHEYYQLLLARIFTGMFGGVLGALVLSIIGDAIPLERRASAMGVVMAAFSVASVVGVPFGLYLATSFTWETPFLLLAGLSTVVSVFIYYHIPIMRAHIVEQHQPKSSPLHFIKNISNHSNQLSALAFMFFIVLSQFTYISMLSPFLVSNVGFTEHQLTYVYLLGGAATIFTSPVVGKLADKYGRVRVFMFFSALAIGPTLYLTSIGHTPLLWVLVVTTLNFIFIGGRMIPGQTMITATVHPQNRGAFMSITSSLQQISSGLGAYIAGAIVAKQPLTGQLIHFEYVGYLAAGCSVCAILLSNKVKPV